MHATVHTLSHGYIIADHAAPSTMPGMTSSAVVMNSHAYISDRYSTIEDYDPPVLAVPPRLAVSLH